MRRVEGDLTVLSGGHDTVNEKVDELYRQAAEARVKFEEIFRQSDQKLDQGKSAIEEVLQRSIEAGPLGEVFTKVRRIEKDIAAAK